VVQVAFVDRELEDRLARHAVGHQRIGDDLEVDVAAVAVPPRQPVPHVLVDLVLAVLALLEPPEALRLRGHALDDGVVVRKADVTVDDHLGDGNPAALGDVVDDPDLRPVAASTSLTRILAA
jgi:hypothetical protein